MARNYPTGVYVQNTSNIAPSVSSVATSIPVFIGYTEKARLIEDGDLLNFPKKVTSLAEYVLLFGVADPEKGISINIDTQKTPIEIIPKIDNPSNFLMFYALQAYYFNGGGSCYIVSVGDYTSGGMIDQAALLEGLKEAGKEDEITLIVYPDGINITPSIDYYALVKQSLNQCNILKDRFTVCDVYMHNDPNINDIDALRNNLAGSVDELKYGASYYPYLEMQLNYHYDEKDVKVDKDGIISTLDTIETNDASLFFKLKNYINNLSLILPPSAAIVGIYEKVDVNRGVWKAPANINVDFAMKPTINISHRDQERLNIDIVSGKSINAIRTFAGHGPAMVWVWCYRLTKLLPCRFISSIIALPS